MYRASATSVLVVVSLAWAVNNLSRWIVPPLIPDIQQTYGIGPALAGLSFSVLWVGYGMIQLPAGALSDRFGRGSVLVPALLGISAGLAIVSLAPTFTIMVLGLFLVGLGAGCVFCVSTSVISEVFPGNREKAMGGFMASGTAAAIVGPLIALLIVGSLGWRDVFLTYSLPGVAVAIALARILGTGSRKSKGPPESITKKSPLASKGIVLIVAVSSIFGCAWNGILAFLPSYLEQQGIAANVATTSYSITFASGAAMLIAAGWLGSKIGSYTITLALMVLGMASYVAMLLTNNPALVLILAVPLGAAIHGFWGPSMTILVDLVPQQNKGTVMGLASTTLGLIEGSSPALVGYVAQRTNLLFAMQAILIFFVVSLAPMVIRKGLFTSVEHAKSLSTTQ